MVVRHHDRTAPHLQNRQTWATCALSGGFGALHDRLLQDLHDQRRIAHLRLADQQVEVFWHDHVADDGEVELAPDFFQDTEERIALAGGGEQRTAQITAASDVVPVIGTVETLQPLGQGEKLFKAPTQRTPR